MVARETPDETMAGRRGHAPITGDAGRRQAPATTPQRRNPSVEGNDIPAPKNRPWQGHAVIRTDWMGKLAIEVPGHNAGMPGLDDKLSFND